MASTTSRRGSKSLLMTILLFQCTTCVAVFLNVPIARQVLGFVFLTFVPGYILLSLLELKTSEGLETFLFSTGLSIAILMLLGLLTNESGALLDILRPLSFVPLMIIVNCFSLVGAVLVYLKGKEVRIWSGKLPESSKSLLPFACLPILSVVGAVWLTSYGNNSIALFAILAISVLFTVSVVYKKLLPPTLYPFAILMIALAVLLHSSLISKYIVTFGSDIHIEYYVFEKTLTGSQWGSSLPFFWDVGWNRVNGMLSVTVLPTVYSTLLNIDPTWMFKAAFPAIFSLVPLGLYSIWQRFLDRRLAFISAFLFIAEATFYSEMLALMRQMIAEFFLVLLLLLILRDKIKPRGSRIICFVIFSFALVTSHYSLSELFLFFIFVTLVSLVILKRASRKITASVVILFLVIMFAWYIFTSNSAAFDSLVGFGQNLRNQLVDFLNPASRGQEVLRGLGMEASPSIWNTMSRLSAYVTQGLIAIGCLGLVTGFTKTRMDRESFTLSLLAGAFLVGLILVPGLANALDMYRFYHVLLFFLAPLSVLGAAILVRLLFKREKQLAISLVLMFVLVTYFLFQTGFVYEITKSDTYSFQLSMYRMSPLRLYTASGYIDAYSIFGAQWLPGNVDPLKTPVYADGVSGPILDTYGHIYTGYLTGLSNTTALEAKGVVYLNAMNIMYETAVLGDLSYNSTQLSSQLSYFNTIYTNGGSQLYKNPQG